MIIIMFKSMLQIHDLDESLATIKDGAAQIKNKLHVTYKSSRKSKKSIG